MDSPVFKNINDGLKYSTSRLSTLFEEGNKNICTATRHIKNVLLDSDYPHQIKNLFYHGKVS